MSYKNRIVSIHGVTWTDKPEDNFYPMEYYSRYEPETGKIALFKRTVYIARTRGRTVQEELEILITCWNDTAFPTNRWQYSTVNKWGWNPMKDIDDSGKV